MKHTAKSFLAFGLTILTTLFISCHSHDINSINVSELKEIISKPHQYTLLDVRTPEETADGKINGAKEADVKSSDFEAQIAKLDKDLSYILYCRSGRRSKAAYHKMTAAGFKKLTNLEGGYLAYTAE